jgi:hypothetical protein
MKGKIIIFAFVKQSAMSQEEKKTNDEEKTIPRPEGYTIVKYAFGWVLFISMLFGLVISAVLIVAFNDYFGETVDWLVWIIPLVIYALFFVIGFRITEVKVNLKITDDGLEQTRLSGSRIYPKYRLIKWEDMKSFHPYGRRNRCQNFYISVRNNVNFRISVPVLALSKWRKDNSDIFEEFRNDFWETAPDHNVHVAFFAIT